MYPYITVFGKQFGTYGLMMALGFALVGVISYFRGKTRNISGNDLVGIAAAVLFGALFGGMLLFVFVTYPIDYIWQMMCSGDFSFFGTGIVYYGGLIAAILCAMLVARLFKCRFFDVERTILPLVPLGHAVGRIGCLLGGCCHGMEYEGPLAVYYPYGQTGLPTDQGYFPVQALEALLNVGICLILLRLEKKTNRPYRLLLYYLGMYAVARFFVEFFRGDAIRGLFLGISTSQWIAIGFGVLSVVALLLQKKKEKTA